MVQANPVHWNGAKNFLNFSNQIWTSHCVNLNLADSRYMVRKFSNLLESVILCSLVI